MTRQCIRCGREITACNGFALARDWGKRLPIREHCGRCVEVLAMMSDEQRRDYLFSLED